MTMRPKGKKVVVGLSGGVDSSIAAALLKEKGYEVIGVSMMIFDASMPIITESERHACYGPGEEEDLKSAAHVCHKLGIPFHAIDLREEFRNHVIEYFRSEYLEGRTPNPCIVCNHKLKFGFLLEKTKELGADFDFFATGHYAQIAESEGRFLLKRAVDLSKDQTYFLYALTPEQLSCTLFPVGGYAKPQVREMAHALGLQTADRPESQDFISGTDYASLFHEEEIKEGEIVDENGNLLGKHRGIIHYTVGQRKGLGIASGRPLYVLRIDAQRNRIVVSDRENLLAQGLIAANLNLIAIDQLDKPHKVKAKIRLQHKEADATLYPHEHNRAKIVFDEPQMSVTPGQSAVFYADDVVLGGGIIEHSI
ncbi:MAG: tRNA 2-thiouridine(34) synthase MnmA [Desulfobacteraceae bacterium]|jgi:tRNA-specific 2-thiouridylase